MYMMQMAMEALVWRQELLVNSYTTKPLFRTIWVFACRVFRVITWSLNFCPPFPISSPGYAVNPGPWLQIPQRRNQPLDIGHVSWMHTTNPFLLSVGYKCKKFNIFHCNGTTRYERYYWNHEEILKYSPMRCSKCQMNRHGLNQLTLGFCYKQVHNIFIQMIWVQNRLCQIADILSNWGHC
jgi:hypothetical protein